MRKNTLLKPELLLLMMMMRIEGVADTDRSECLCVCVYVLYRNRVAEGQAYRIKSHRAFVF